MGVSMQSVAKDAVAEVTYRATAAGRDVQIQLRVAPATATAADAYRRLSARYPGVDPLSLEIEHRRAAHTYA
jgi:hypothetical protein